MTVNWTNDQGISVSDVSGVKTSDELVKEFGGTGWKIVVPPAPTPLTPAQMFNVTLFCEALFTAFAADSNLFPYYAVLKDLAIFQNFAGMNTIVNALLAAGILTQAEVTTLNGILAQQNIVLANF